MWMTVVVCFCAGVEVSGAVQLYLGTGTTNCIRAALLAGRQRLLYDGWS